MFQLPVNTTTRPTYVELLCTVPGEAPESGELLGETLIYIAGDRPEDRFEARVSKVLHNGPGSLTLGLELGEPGSA